jgi:hypothetical protein
MRTHLTTKSLGSAVLVSGSDLIKQKKDDVENILASRRECDRNGTRRFQNKIDREKKKAVYFLELTETYLTYTIKLCVPFLATSVRTAGQAHI